MSRKGWVCDVNGCIVSGAGATACIDCLNAPGELFRQACVGCCSGHCNVCGKRSPAVEECSNCDEACHVMPECASCIGESEMSRSAHARFVGEDGEDQPFGSLAARCTSCSKVMCHWCIMTEGTLICMGCGADNMRK